MHDNISDIVATYDQSVEEEDARLVLHQVEKLIQLPLVKNIAFLAKWTA